MVRISPAFYGFAAPLLILCSVTKYTSSTATLTLHHNYPTVSASPTSVASVDVNLLLSTLKPTDTQVGEWVNVIGYITSQPTRTAKTEPRSASEALKWAKVFVQAVMLWSAGSIKLGEYERVLAERKDVDKRLRAPA